MSTWFVKFNYDRLHIDKTLGNIQYSDKKKDHIGVGAHSTLGQGIFARKYMYEKLPKCPNFTWHLPENARILRDNCRKNIFLEFWEGTFAPSWPRRLRLWGGQEKRPECLAVLSGCTNAATASAISVTALRPMTDGTETEAIINSMFLASVYGTRVSCKSCTVPVSSGDD